MRAENQIDYVELPASDFAGTKKFFAALFGWTFQDYGEDYIAFSDGRLDGGFFRSDHVASSANGSALLVFYTRDLEASHAAVVGVGGRIVKDIFAFPGGRRFHFLDPNGNEYAFWSDAAGD